MDVTADGTRLILAETAASTTESSASTLLIWDLGRSEVISRIGPFPLAVQSIMVVPDGSAALVACGDNTVRRLALDAAAPELTKLPAPLVTVEPSYGALAAAVLSVDGGLLVTMNGADARLFDTNSGRELMAFRPQDALADAEFSPDGQLIITASWDGTVRFWNAGQRPPTTIATLVAHEQFINSAVFSPDGSLVLTASDDRTARLWDTQARTPVHKLTGHTGAVNQAVFSYDGALVLTVSDDRTARLWDVRTGKEVGDPFRDGHSRPILSGAFAADGRRIVTGSEDNLALVWSVEDRAPVAILGGHTAAITAVAFSADDARVFTASRDSTVKVWDVSADGMKFSPSLADTTGLASPVAAVDLLTLKGHHREVTSLSISSDGKSILTGSRDRTAIIWRASDWPKTQ
jgi:WD40 repeat protein